MNIPTNPEYHKIKLKLLLDEIQFAIDTCQDEQSLKARVSFIIKKHKTTLAFSEDSRSVSFVPDNIH